MPDSTTRLGRQILSQLAEDTDLVIEFFAVFSRMEYALKASGFTRPLSAGSRVVAADWDGYARVISAEFKVAAHQQDIAVASQYLVERPPEQQVFQGDRIGWRSTRGYVHGFSAPRVLRSVVQVRNNLFHGCKYPIPTANEPSRNALLLTHGLTILEACLALEDGRASEVRARFDEPLFPWSTGRR